MTSAALEPLQDYSIIPSGTLYLEGIHIGGVCIDRAVINSRESAIKLQDYCEWVLEISKKKRVPRNGTRYPEPLPLGTPARRLSAEIRDHLEDMTRRKLDAKTVDATRRTLKFLLLSCGDVSVARIDYKQIHETWRLLRWAPKNLMSDPRLKSLSYDEAIALGQKEDVPPLAPATEERHRRFLVSFFNHLLRARAIPASPMDAFKKPEVDYTLDPNKAIRLFEDADLQAIFNPETFIPWAKKPHLWWAPMIGLYTGARINEVCQLKLIDIVQERGTWCFAFRKTVDADLAADPKRRRVSRQSLKGRGCARMIPIAQALIDAGFLDYLADAKATGHARLFPHLSAGINRKTGETNARYSHALVVDFGRYLKALGFSKGVGFHAFRHTLATELDAQDVPQREIALVTGHATDPLDHVEVLRRHYLHKKPHVTRAKQIKTLELYQPNVVLPAYSRGQFSVQLGDPSKFHP